MLWHSVNAMNIADYAIVAVLLSSVLWAIRQGLLHTMSELLNWMIALAIALLFIDELALVLTRISPIIEIRLLLAFICLFSSTFLLANLLSYLLIQLFPEFSMSLLEYLLTPVLGLFKAILIILVFFIILTLTPIKQTAIWQSSWIIHYVLIDTSQKLLTQMR